MSGCLIFQLPDICSTTSRESIRTSSSASGRVLAVELQPGDQAAVLRDVVGGDADRLAPLGDRLAGGGILQHGAVRRRAGVAARAAVGLDDDASGVRSQSRLRGAHQDPLALLAADHLVGRGRGHRRAGRPRHGEPAATALRRGSGRRRPRRPSAPAAARRAPSGRPAGLRPRRARSRSSAVTSSRIAARLLVAGGGERVSVRSSNPASSLVTFSSSVWVSSSRSITSSSVVLERGDPALERLQLVAHPLQVLGVGDQALVHPAAVALAPGLHLLDVGVGLALLGGQVVDGHAQVTRPVVELLAPGLVARRARAISGIVRSWWARPSRTGVELLHVEQLELGERVGFQGVSSVGSTRNVHGSVGVVLTRTSTVSPSAAASSRRSTGSQVHSAAQCATSTSAGPLRGASAPGTRLPGGGAGRRSRRRPRRCVATWSSRKSPAPPHSATVRTCWSGSPATRTPCAVAGSASATCSANSRSVVGAASVPIRPCPRAGSSVGSELDDVVCRLLVRVRRQHRGDDALPRVAAAAPPRRALVDHLELPDGADRGRRPVERAEPALPRRREARRVVAADPAGPGLGQRASYGVGVGTGTNTTTLSSGSAGVGLQRRDVAQTERQRQRLGDAASAASALVWAVYSAQPPRPGRARPGPWAWSRRRRARRGGSSGWCVTSSCACPRSPRRRSR